MKMQSLLGDVNNLILDCDLFDGKKFKLERNESQLLAISDNFKVGTSLFDNTLSIFLTDFKGKVDFKLSDDAFDLNFTIFSNYSSDFMQTTRVFYDDNLNMERQFLYSEEIGDNIFGRVELGLVNSKGRMIVNTSDKGYNDDFTFAADLIRNVKNGFRRSKVIQCKIDRALSFSKKMVPNIEEFLEDNFPILIEDGMDGYDFYQCCGNTVVNDICRFIEDQKAKKMRIR